MEKYLPQVARIWAEQILLSNRDSPTTKKFATSLLENKVYDSQQITDAMSKSKLDPQTALYNLVLSNNPASKTQVNTTKQPYGTRKPYWKK